MIARQAELDGKLAPLFWKQELPGCNRSFSGFTAFRYLQVRVAYRWLYKPLLNEMTECTENTDAAATPHLATIFENAANENVGSNCTKRREVGRVFCHSVLVEFFVDVIQHGLAIYGTARGCTTSLAPAKSPSSALSS